MEIGTRIIMVRINVPDEVYKLATENCGWSREDIREYLINFGLSGLRNEVSNAERWNEEYRVFEHFPNI